MISTVILISLLTTIYVYYKLFKLENYWTIRNIICPKPLPVVGNLGKVIFRMKSFPDLILDLYNQLPNHSRYSGFFQFSRPCLFVRDLDLIKQICVKYYDHFTDHYVFFCNENSSSILVKMLFALKGEEWKKMRYKISPAFTSNKIKFMYSLMVECAENMVHHLSNQKQDLLVVNIKEIASRYGNDVIATIAFGIKCDSFSDPSNEFYTNGQKVFSFSAVKNLNVFLLQLFPKLSRVLGLKFFSDSGLDFFRKIILDTIQKREKEGIVRPDLIHLLMETKKEGSKNFAPSGESPEQFQKQLTNDDIAAQAFNFFLASFDTVSTTSLFTCLELAANPSVQKKLQTEIDSVLETCNNETISYQTLLQIKYLDQVLSESLRLWPSGYITDRLCVKDFLIKPTNPNERTLVVEKGVNCILPIIGLHRDPKFFPNPLRFDPDRFSDENKPNIAPGTYYPFGIGPRTCIGYRVALLEIKLFLFYLLSKFDLVLVDKTKVPIKSDPAKLFLIPEGGYWLGLKTRSL